MTITQDLGFSSFKRGAKMKIRGNEDTWNKCTVGNPSFGIPKLSFVFVCGDFNPLDQYMFFQPLDLRIVK